ncbi:hypothetical protein VPHK479_0105 [Vibrio phage K479]
MTTYDFYKVLKEHKIDCDINAIGLVVIENCNWIHETDLRTKEVTRIRRRAYVYASTLLIEETDRKVLTIATLLGIEVSPL